MSATTTSTARPIRMPRLERPPPPAACGGPPIGPPANPGPPGGGGPGGPGGGCGGSCWVGGGAAAAGCGGGAGARVAVPGGGAAAAGCGGGTGTGMTLPTAVAPASTAPPSTVIVLWPTRTWSLGLSGTWPVMRLPFTNVPFVEPRSSIISRPLGSWKTRACTREISESPPRLPRPGVERPMTSSCSRGMSCPAAFPPTIFSVSFAIVLHPNHAVGGNARRDGACVVVLTRSRWTGDAQELRHFLGQAAAREQLGGVGRRHELALRFDQADAEPGGASRAQGQAEHSVPAPGHGRQIEQRRCPPRERDQVVAAAERGSDRHVVPGPEQLARGLELGRPDRRGV